GRRMPAPNRRSSAVRAPCRGHRSLGRSFHSLCMSAEALEGRVLLSAYVVTNLNDSGVGSLRDAIQQANSNPIADTISFATPAGTITLTSGSLDITDDLTVIGPGPQWLSVSGNSMSRVFRIGTDV